MDFIVYNEKAVMILVGQLDEFYSRILFVMFLQVHLELLVISAIYCSHYTFSTFI